MATDNFFTDLQAFMAHKDHNTTLSQGMFMFGALRALEQGVNWQEQHVRWDLLYADVRLQKNYPGKSNELEQEALDLLMHRLKISLEEQERCGILATQEGVAIVNDQSYRPGYCTLYITTWRRGLGQLPLVVFFNPQGREFILGGDPSRVAAFVEIIHEINAGITRKAQQLIDALPLKKETQ